MPTLTKTLKTDVMADLDLKGLAQILRSKGRGRDTVLAHITPREAARLKAQGGSGTINPETGLPEFEDGDVSSFNYGGAESFGEATAAMPSAQAASDYAASTMTPLYEERMNMGETFAPSFGGGGAGGGLPPVPEVSIGGTPGAGPSVALAPELQTTGATTAAAPAGGTAEKPEDERGYFSRLGSSLQKQLEDPATLARLGLGLGVGGLGAFQQQRAGAAAKRARDEMRAIGAPYRAQGQELIAQAQRGELSPASAQAYQAAQAKIAQQVARTGGVGAVQGAANLERLRSQLLTTQTQLGLNIANIGDQYMRGAIQTGMQANQALMQATNQFYSMLGSVVSGPAGQAVANAAR